MKKILITGATGMVGSIALRECLQAKEVASVVSLTRKAAGIEHPKLTEVIHEDFTNYSGLEAHFTEVDAAIFCIGVYTGQVPDDRFKVITVDFVQAFADVLKAKSPGATFCLLSGAGADLTEKSRFSFARYKGMAENYLMEKEFGNLYLFRPGYIYPVEKREEPNMAYRVYRALYPVINRLFPKTSITSEQLGLAMVRGALYGAPSTILENEDIKKV